MTETHLQPAAVGSQLMQRSLGERVIAVPCAKDIYLVSFWIAGTRHRDAYDLVDLLTSGTPLDLRREPSNPKDALAIAVLTEQGVRLGYVPNDTNVVLARLMDAGKYLRGVTRRTSRSPTGLPGIRVRVYMQNL